jgi:hypothetical protein
VGQLPLERRVFRLVGLEHLGDETDLGVHPGPRHDPPAPSVGDDRAHESHVDPVAQGNVLLQDLCRVFLDRHRLAGQGGFFDLEIHAFDQAHVRRDAVSRFQKDHIACHQFPGRAPPAAVRHGCLGAGGGHLLEGGDRLLALDSWTTPRTEFRR